ncbi:1-phosphofructokinase family hexose kinase [Paenibacillus senegalensis]|uniref:1-phosphofructokinase family hexose kinase n=1 Tax=Paenibacillus senegalensis TaxID=1465766 RepID=UPI00028983A4|nr:1-phosphofructokinase family hexose kinase [Paenibacillus senegalensis]
MITTVTLNAAIDKTYYLDHYQFGKVNRASQVYAVPGGKGINVARVVHALGQPVTASGVAGGKNGEFITEGLQDIGIPSDFVRTANGESRLCLNMISLDSMASTEVLEPGPVLSPDDLDSIRRKIAELAGRSSIVALSGSLPAGAPKTLYKELIALIKEKGAKAFLDASGEALVHGVAAKPDFIKPNEDEIAALIGSQADSEEAILDAIRRLMEQGIACVAVTLGASGSLVGCEGRCYRVQAPAVEAVNAVGCGDSFVAGMAIGQSKDWPIEHRLAYATATATANALTKQAGEVYASDVERLLAEVRVSEI